MRTRIDAGTDVAMIGAWDASGQDSPLPPSAAGHLESLEHDAAEGRLFLLHTGADCGGAIDVYVDEDPPADLIRHAKRVGGEFLLRLPTGRLLVGGAEDYRSPQPRITSPGSIVTLPAGDYSVRCYSIESDHPSAEKELLRQVPEADVIWFDRINHLGCLLSPVALLLFPLLLIWLNWKFALPIALLAVLLYFHLFTRLVRLSPRYRHLDEIIPKLRLASEPPMFILILHPLADTSTLTGGSASL